MSQEAELVQHKYIPRSQFLDFHSRKQRFALMVCHRRAGKTVAVLNDMVIRALRTTKRHAFYAYVAPFMGQAKQASWTYLKEAVANIPGHKVNLSELTITLPNGARIRVFGADNADALRGLYFDGIVLDEFGDMNSRVYTEIVRPALSDRKGWAVFIGTPKGKNKFYDLRNKAIEDSDRWFYKCLKASESGIISKDELEDMTRDMDEYEIRQELECDFESAIRGSYYGKHMAALEAAGRFTKVDWDPSEKVSCSFDIGYRDSTAIWFWQVIDGQVRIIDYEQFTERDAAETIEVMQLKPYDYETWWLPHDARHRTFASRKSVMDTFLQYEAPVQIAPNLKVRDGIDSVRKTLRTYPVYFDAERCKQGIECLRNYSRKWNADSSVFSDEPSHDQWSHGADSFRYLSLVINIETIKNSVEKAARKRTAKLRMTTASQAVQANQITIEGYTFQQAFAERERKLKALNGAGRQRI